MSKNLQSYIDQQNIWSRFTKKPLIELKTLTAEQAKDLYMSIDGDLSPENLHCDGEITAAQARRKARFLRAVISELKALGFQKPENTYCI